MNDNNLNGLLKWGIRNSENANEDPTSESDDKRDPNRGLNAEAIQQLMGGPSDADMMREAMTVIVSPDAELDNKLTAFDNFEQLIETIDNANNMESLGLWMPLIEQLDNPEAEMRTMALWCIATAVQNNPRSQERVFVIGVVPKLVTIALNDSNMATRKKAVFALSSEVRNYQPALNAMLEDIPADLGGKTKVDAADMDAVDSVIGKMREHVQK